MLLYKMNKSNLISWWKIERDGSSYTISWGQDHTKQGPSKNQSHHECESEEKCITEFESRINHQEKRLGYTPEIPKKRADRPMLAQRWEDYLRLTKRDSRKDFANFAVQPKLDGMRCIACKDRMISRKNDLIVSAPHISALLSHLEEDVKLDGELYIPSTDLQTIMSFVRRTNVHPDFQLIEYHVFDTLDLESEFVHRYEFLKDVVNELEIVWKRMQDEIAPIPKKFRELYQVETSCPIKLVPTKWCSQESDISLYHKENLHNKYEGSIIRNPAGLYEMDCRSENLLKYKEYIDDEYEIVDVVEAHEKTGIFVCKTAEGKIFDVTPAWTKDAMRLLLIKKEYYIGRMLTVRYEKLSRDGVPIPAKGHETRAKEEVGL